MSKTVDSRVVEMRFDNSQFEKNVNTSMSTLDKLKHKLNLDGASKGLENLNAEAKKCNLSPIASGVETVRTKFSAMEVMAVTALANITNSAVNAGKRIASSLTIEPVKQGFSEYELKMGSVQTIMASTGENLETINGYLEELNTYADKTIYSFSDMTSSIGKFTNAGVDLDSAVKAIQGISNEAAVSGANAEQASHAMYNFAQALSSGAVKLIDWKSIENANMATVEFKQELLDTALALGTVEKVGDKYRSTTTDLNGKVSELFTSTSMFNDSLSSQWMTTDVLVKTLGRYADETTEIGKKAFAAAQDVKTFSQLMDTLKEAVGSGWAQTWELIFGDFNEAKALWTEASEFFGGIIDKASKFRNELLGSALGKTFSEISKKIDGAFKPVKKVTEVMDKASESVADLGKIVDEVIIGKFGNGQERFDKLTAAGQNYYRIQNKVNEALGSAARYSDERIEAQDKLLGTQKEQIDTTKEETKEVVKLDDATKNRLHLMARMDEARMRELGYTDKQIEAFEELRKTAEKLGMPLNEFINKMDEIDGRWILIDSFRSIGKALVEVFKAIGKAWQNVFPSTLDDKANALFDIIAAFHKLSRGVLTTVTDNADKLRRTFEGLFAILDVIRSIVGGALKIAFNIIGKVLEAFNINIFDVTASIGDQLVAFRDWIKSNETIKTVIESVTNALADFIVGIVNTVKAIYEWVKAFLKTEEVQNVITAVQDTCSSAYDAISTYFTDLGVRIGEFIERVKAMDGISLDNIGAVIEDFVKNVLQLDFSSLFEQLQTGFGNIGNFFNEKIQEMGVSLEDFKELLKKILPAVGALSFGVGLTVGINKLVEVFESVTGPIQAFTDGIEMVSKAATKFIKAKAFEANANAILKIAIAIAVLAVSIAALANVPQENLWSSVGAIGTLALELAVLAAAMSLLGKFANIKQVGTGLLFLGGALLAVTICLKLLEDMDPDRAKENAVFLGVIAVALLIAAKMFSKTGPEITKAGGALVAISVAVFIMVKALEKINSLKTDNILESIFGLIGVVVALKILMKAFPQEGTLGSGVGMIAVVLSLYLFIGVLEKITEINTNKILNHLDAILVIIGSFSLLMLSTKLAGENAAKAGIGMIAIAAALLLTVRAIRLLGEMEGATLTRGTAAVSELIKVFSLIVAASLFAGENAIKAGVMLMMMAGTLLVVTGVMYLMQGLSDEGMDRALGAIKTLCELFALLIASTVLSKSGIGTLVVLTVAIAILSGVLIALSAMPDQSAVTNAATALSAVVGVFALLFLVMNAIEPKGKLGEKVATLAVLTVVVAGLASILIAMSNLQNGGNPSSALANAASLSLLLLALSGACLILGQVKGYASGAKTTALVLTGLVAVLAGILVAMSHLAGPNVEAAMAFAGALAILLPSIAVSCLILSKISAAAAGASAGAYAMLGVIGVISLVLVAIGALLTSAQEYFGADVGGLLETMGDLLTKLGAAIGGFIGGLIGGIGAGITSMLPKMAADLSAFMLLLQPFISGAKSIDSSVMNSIDILASTVLKLTAASFLDAIAGLYGCDFTTLGKSLASFGSSMKDFAEAVSSLTDEEIATIEATAPAAKSLAEVAEAIPKEGGLAGALFGEADYVTFGANMVSFGYALMDYASVVSGFTEADSTNIQNSATAAGYMTDLVDKMPKTGGVAQWLFGEVDFVGFGANMVAFGFCLMDYVKVVSDFTSESSKKIEDTATAAGYLTKVAETIPKSDGVAQWLFGSVDMVGFGTNLESFGKSLVAYANIVSGFTDTDVANIERSATGVEKMVDVVEKIPTTGGISEFFTGTKDLTKFGNGIMSIADGLSKYTKAAKDIDQAAIDKIDFSKKAVEALVGVTEVLAPEGGLKGIVKNLLYGEVDVAGFGTGMVALAQGLVDYSAAAKDVTQDTIDKINFSKNAVTAMVNVAKELPTEGGFMNNIRTFFNGSTDYSFGSALIDLAESLITFCEKVESFDATDLANVQRVASITSAMATVANAIPTSGGLVEWVEGKKDISLFGAQLSKFAASIRVFMLSVEELGLETGDEKLVDPIIAMTSKMIALSNMIPTSGGLVAKVEGDNTIDDFGSQLSSFVYSLTTFVQQCKDISEDDIKEVKKVETLTDELTTTMVNVSEDLEGFDTKIFDTAVGSLKGFISAINEIASSDTSGASSITKSLNDLGSVSVDSFVSSFKEASESKEISNLGKNLIDNVAKGMTDNDESLKTSFTAVSKTMLTNAGTSLGDFTKLGENLVGEVAKGVDNKKKSLTDKTSSLVGASVDEAKRKYSDFQTAGSYLVDGFSAGISSKTWAAEAKAKAMAKAAKEAAEAELGIASPSKVFYKIGSYTGEGFINALDDYSTKVYYAGANVGHEAENGLSRAISKISTLINSGIDTQPTIRPVVDLSEVEAGAGTIGDLFSVNPSVGVLSNVRSINTMMNSRQNGASNSDLLSAIKDLGSKLGTSSGDTYSINGITYDDGSNISDAVKSLVRAARVERRI